MPPLNKNGGLGWTSRAARWFTPLELLALQGHPVYESLQHAAFGATCSFNMPRDRSRNAMGGQAGNSFNLNMIGVVLLYVLLYAPIVGK